jgi:Asp-tRNA(Asn)/Glu-tRNA(Gln) amidotransferase A subunit family amidase
MTSKIYISGKIGNLPFDQVRAKFDAAKAHLEEFYEVISPIDLPHNHDKSWGSYMIEDLKALMNCQVIYMLHDWTHSPGATIEHHFAVSMGIRVTYQSKP